MTPTATIRCPNDAGRIALLTEREVQPGRVVRCFWCPFCAELFGRIDDEEGSRPAGTFALDQSTGRFTLHKSTGAAGDIRAAQMAAATITPL
jgi:hypothetical protein